MKRLTAAHLATARIENLDALPAADDAWWQTDAGRKLLAALRRWMTVETAPAEDVAA